MNSQNTPRPPEEIREQNQSLWMLTISPTIWAVHFLASYITAAVWCEKYAGRDGTLWNARLLIAIYTAVALAGIAVTAWTGWKRQQYGDASLPHDFDSPEDRHRFLGFATLLLSGLSVVATIFVALVAVFVRTCH
ncbi:MAG: hypothetical protein KDA79_12235 [Planctomycetaceae bacterium]|nr:hypothetical protein [Planctomycetaceae bacterium]